MNGDLEIFREDNCFIIIIIIILILYVTWFKKINISMEVYTYKLLSTLTVSNQSEKQGTGQIIN